MKRVDLMMLTLRDGNSLEIPVSLESLTIHFRHMTKRSCSGGTESGQVLRVTLHIVLSSHGVNNRSRQLDWQFARPENITSNN